jgi:hypothetical protein
VETTQVIKPIVVSDDEKKYWLQRFWNPEIRFRWNAAIRVDPANSLKGKMVGVRYYPDGTVETYAVS